MGRKKDPFWDYVDKLNDKVIKCKFCGDEFAGGASRIKGHLSGIGGKGIHACSRVPKEVQIAASSTFGDSNETPCTSDTPSSNKPNDSSRGKGVLGHADVVGHVQTAPLGHVNPISFEVNCLGYNQSAMRDVNSSYAEANCLISNQSIMRNVDLGGPQENRLISNLNITRNINSSDLSREKSITGRKKDLFWQYIEPGLDGKVKCVFCGHEFAGGASRIKWHLSKTEKMGVEICCNVPENVQKAADEAFNKRTKRNIISTHLEDNFVASNFPSSSSKGNTELYPILTSTDFIGEEFQSYIDKIWDWIMNEKGSVIGVCGMGGVGKTTVLKHVCNKLLDHSLNVKWVDVPQNCSVSQLQKAITESCDLQLLGWEGTTKVATELSAVFKKMKKCIIVLDNVWDHINLEQVGIPLTDCEVQVIITSRLFDVCQIMGCKNHILRMKPLLSDDEQSWYLFLKVLGEDESELSPEVTDIAKSIVDECDGLPFAIATLAIRMRGKEGIREWKYILENLRNSRKGQEDMKKNVLPSLALSYNHLNDKCLQECFLCCAFILEYNDDSLTWRPEDLIIYLIDEGLIDRKNSLEAELDEDHIILDKLIDSNLLMEDDERYVRIHDLVGDMAASIAEVDEVYRVKGSKDLTALEQERKKRVQLRIEEIPSGISPKCPKLSTLILSHTRLIPDSFFINMPSLKVLDLSYCYEIQHLPAFISNLVSLTALLLHGCESLESVPSLAKLQNLDMLDLFGTRISKLPLGLEMLINLRWLDLRETDELIISPASVIPKLINLQVLLLEPWNESMYVKAADLEGLIMLESISANFSDENEFTAYVRVVNAQNRGVKNYYLSLMERKPEDWADEDYTADIECGSNKAMVMFVGIENAASMWLPVGMNELIIEECDEWRSLCDVLSFDYKNPRHWSCKIKSCSELENVFCLSSSCAFCSSTHSLKSLSLKDLESLSMLCNETNVAATALPFSSLRSLKVSSCNHLKTLLTPGMIGHLQNLETLYVSYCYAMEEIFSSEKNNEEETLLVTDVDIEAYQLLQELLPPEMGRNHQEEQVADAVQIDHPHPSMIKLPKLKSATLGCLPQLKRVYEGILVCDSLQKFKIRRCSNLKQLPKIQSASQEFKIQGCASDVLFIQP